jgi:hypothetical protein
MKNTIKILGIIALAAFIGISIIGCNDDGAKDSAGQLTINGLGDFNGKYIYVQTWPTATNGIVAAASLSFTKPTTLGLISNGSVTLKVWEVNTTNAKITGFDKSGPYTFDNVIIGETATDSDNESSGKVTADFANGIGEGFFSID